MIKLYLPAFIIGVLICSGLTYYVKILAEKNGWFDKPSPRKVHPYPVPRLGGVAIVSTLLILLVGYSLASERLSFSSSTIFHIDSKIFGLLIGLLILITVGIVDDIRSVAPLKKLFWQTIAAIVVVGFGVSISFIRLPFGEHLDLTNTILSFSLFNTVFHVTLWADLLAVFWIILLINTFNFLDGLDGLSSGIAFIAVGTIFFLSVALNQGANALLAVIIAGAIFGFIPWNYNPAKIFLGDSGSMSIGYLVGVLAMISGGKLATSFLVLGIPLLDVGWVILRRIVKGKSPLIADKRHFHHRLLTAGFSQKQAVAILYLLSMIFGLVAILSKTDMKIKASIILFGVMIALALVLIVLELKRKRNV